MRAMTRGVRVRRMEQEVASSGPATDSETLTLADLDACAGVIPDPTGDYAAGRTVFFSSTEDFLEALESGIGDSG